MRQLGRYATVLFLGVGLLGWQDRASAQSAYHPRPPIAVSPPVSEVSHGFPAPRQHQLEGGESVPISTAAGPSARGRAVIATTPATEPSPALLRPVMFQPTPDASGPHRATEMVTEPLDRPGEPVQPMVLGAQAPSVHLEKVGPASVNLAQPLTYEIVVRNAGSVPVFHGRVEDEIPKGARYVSAQPEPEKQGERLSWSLGLLEPGAERRFQVVVQPVKEEELLSRATVTFSASSGLQTRITQPRLTLTKSGPETVQVGDPVDFQIAVTNAGTGPATSVVLRDQLPPGLQHPQGSIIETEIGTLAAGETKNITLRTAAVHSGRQVNEAVVTAEGGLQATAQAAVNVTEPALVLHKSGPQHCFLDREAEYRLEVSNSGTAPATNVQLADMLPEGLAFISASDQGIYEPAARRVIWALGTLEAGQRRGLSVKVLAQGAGDWINRAVVQADRGLERKAEVPVHVEGVSALMLEVVDLEDPVEVGAETTYEIRVVNQGSCAVTNVIIVATVPSGMAPGAAEGPAFYRVEGGQVVFEPLAKLAARADARYRVRVRGMEAGDGRFKVEMACDQLQRPVREEESTRVYSN